MSVAMRTKWRNWTGLLAVLLLFAGCGGKKQPTYLDETANFALVERVAVMPLENFSNEAHAAAKVEQILTIELLAAGAFEVVDSTRIAGALADDDARASVLREATARHAAAGLPQVFSGSYEGEHWLGSFAIYLLTGVGQEA